MSRYGSTKSVSRVRKWRSRPRGRGPFDNLDPFSRETTLNRNLIGCQQIGLKRTDDTHLESPNRDCVDELVARLLRIDGVIAVPRDGLLIGVLALAPIPGAIGGLC